VPRSACTDVARHDQIFNSTGAPSHLFRLRRRKSLKKLSDLDSCLLLCREYSVGGSYRNFVAKPSQLDWKILRYKEPDSPLLRTDPEELEGKPEPRDDPGEKSHFVSEWPTSSRLSSWICFYHLQLITRKFIAF